MKIKVANFSILLLAILLHINSFGANASSSKDVKNETKEFDPEKIIEEYKGFVKATKPTTRKEVIEFRKKNAELNRQKSELYKALSQEAQDYLKKEKDIRAKLPIEKRREYIKKFYLNDQSDGQDKDQKKD